MLLMEKTWTNLLPLIRLYQEVYKHLTFLTQPTGLFFAQFGEQYPTGCQILYRQGTEVVGFVSTFSLLAPLLPAELRI